MAAEPRPQRASARARPTVSEPRRLSDVELRAQLERRVANERSRAERGSAFVTSIRHKIDAEPQAVPAARLPALAGLLAGLAILIVLVVAAPGMTPVGSSAIVTPGQAQSTVTAIPTAAAVLVSPSTSPFVARGCQGTVNDETGLITRCRRAAPASAEPAPVVVSNEDPGNLVLVIEWASVCEIAGRFTFLAAVEGYELISESDQPTNSLCDGVPNAHRLELDLLAPVKAAEVAVRTAHLAMVCSQELGQPFRVHATIRDEAAIVEWCEGIAATGEPELPVLNPDGDLRVLRLNWMARECDADPHVTFSRLGDGFSAHGVLYQKTCRSIPAGHSLLLHLREDVSADDVISQFDRHTLPEPTP